MDLTPLTLSDSPHAPGSHPQHRPGEHQQHHQQQHRGGGAGGGGGGGGGGGERLPRCSTVSLQTELATPALVVFSGGTAFNSVAGHLRKLTTRVSHVLPVSDDGGSTAEIVRVIGGPAVGDIRSRCLRLADDTDAEARAVKRLLAHRLPGSSSQEAKLEWYSIAEGTHPLWGGVSEPYKHMIRAFLVEFQCKILGQVTREFNFMNGSIGNFFFAGARCYFGSLESAIFLFSKVARFPEGSSVLPAICTEEVITLGAELEDGTVLRGQNNISHPDVGAAGAAAGAAGGGSGGGSDGGGGGGVCGRGGAAAGAADAAAAAPPPGPSAVDKSSSGALLPLPSPVRRVFYLSREGTGQEHEVAPAVNPAVLQAVQACDAIVYGMGSLYTSICPALILDGVGEAIAARQDVPKLLLLNGSHDRETATCGGHSGAMRASDVVAAVTDALNRRRSRPVEQAGRQRCPPMKHPASSYVTCLVTPRGGSIEIDRPALELLGVTQVIEVAAAASSGSGTGAGGDAGGGSDSSGGGRGGTVVYDPEELVLAIGQALHAHGQQQHGGGGGGSAAAGAVTGGGGSAAASPHV